MTDKKSPQLLPDVTLAPADFGSQKARREGFQIGQFFTKKFAEKQRPEGMPDIARPCIDTSGKEPVIRCENLKQAQELLELYFAIQARADYVRKLYYGTSE